MRKNKKTSPISYEEMMDRVSSLSLSSSTYKKFGLYIEKHYMDLGFMSAEEVADAVGISQGSVSRFCKDLGFLGYSDFIKKLHSIFCDNITAPDRIQRNADKKGNIHKEIIDEECANLQKLLSVTESDEYSKLVKFISESQSIHLVSSRYTSTILPYATYMLSKMRDNVYMETPGSIEFQNLIFKNKKETGILVFSFPRYANDLIDMIKQVKASGIKYHLITDSRMCPMYADAENTVILPITTSSVFNNYGVPITFTNLLMNDVAKALPNVKKRISKIEAFEKENQIYYDK